MITQQPESTTTDVQPASDPISSMTGEGISDELAIGTESSDSPADEDRRVRQILKTRAVQLAIEPQVETMADAILDVVEFHLAQERFAIESRFVREVIPVKHLTPLPCTPRYVVGLTNLRGEIHSVIDLKQLYDLPEQALGSQSRIMILRNEDMEFGILVDAVSEVRAIPINTLQTSLPTLTDIRVKYLRGITENRLTILDAGALLTDPDLIIDEMA